MDILYKQLGLSSKFLDSGINVFLMFVFTTLIYILVPFVSTIIFNIIYNFIQKIVPYNYHQGNRNIFSDNFWKMNDPFMCFIGLFSFCKNLFTGKNKRERLSLGEFFGNDFNKNTEEEVINDKISKLYFEIIPILYLTCTAITCIFYYSSKYSGLISNFKVLEVLLYLYMLISIICTLPGYVMPFFYGCRLVAEIIKLLAYDPEYDDRVIFTQDGRLVYAFSNEDKEYIATAAHEKQINKKIRANKTNSKEINYYDVRKRKNNNNNTSNKTKLLGNALFLTKKDNTSVKTQMYDSLEDECGITDARAMEISKLPKEEYMKLDISERDKYLRYIDLKQQMIKKG